MPRPIVVPWRDGYVRPRVPLRDPNPYCVLGAAATLVHHTGPCMPTEMVGQREMHVLELLRGGWGVLRSALLSAIGRAGARSAECHVRRAVREISERGDTCSARIDTRRLTVEDARRSRNLLSCLQGVFRVPLMPIA